MTTGFLITARLKSSRLPKKILLDLNGLTIIERIIVRCKSIKGIDKVVLCTSVNPQDDELEFYADKHKIEIFRGSEDDVMHRLLSAAQNYDIDKFVGITADNPLFCQQTAEKQVEMGKTDEHDFIFVKNIPIGCATYHIDVKALDVAYYMKNIVDTEIWGPFINRPDFFRVGDIFVENSPYSEIKRLTCDFPEDYELFKQIFNYFPEDKVIDLKEVFNLLLTSPELWKINSMHVQRMLSDEILKNISDNFEKNKHEGVSYAIKINKKVGEGLYEKFNISL